MRTRLLTVGGLIAWALVLAVLVCGTGWSDAPTPPSSLTNSIGIKLVLVPAGRFVMGSPLTEPERDVEEVPHEVVISRPFYMGAYEVTQGEFLRVMGNKIKPALNRDTADSASYPMESMLWKEAVAFCDQLSQLPAEKSAGRQYRLPTEAEWEYACRAGTTTAFHYGNALSSRQANFNGNFVFGDAEKGPYVRKTTKVGSFPPNAFGLYDMHGNVWEWCADWYDANYYRQSPTEDPLGPPMGVTPTGYGDFYLVIRGGCWLDDARACRSAYRFRAMPDNRYQLIGFRVVCEVAE